MKNIIMCCVILVISGGVCDAQTKTRVGEIGFDAGGRDHHVCFEHAAIRQHHPVNASIPHPDLLHPTPGDHVPTPRFGHPAVGTRNGDGTTQTHPSW